LLVRNAGMKNVGAKRRHLFCLMPPHLGSAQLIPIKRRFKDEPSLLVRNAGMKNVGA